MNEIDLMGRIANLENQVMVLQQRVLNLEYRLNIIHQPYQPTPYQPFYPAWPSYKVTSAESTSAGYCGGESGDCY